MEKILRVNLDDSKIATESVSEKYLEKYIGGMGVATAIFTKEVPANIDAYDKKNLLIFSVGPFCGTMVPFCSRHFIMSKSPLTNILGESSAGGFWGTELRFAGYNHIIISGNSLTPVYLWIKDNNIEIRDASDLWNKGVFETQEILKSKLGDEKVKIALIGQAGENLVKYASIMNDKDRAAGRCGLGAVMGNKKLKAIAVRGSGKAEVKNKEILSKAVSKFRELVKNNPVLEIHAQYGTTLGIDNMPHIGDVPIKNFTMSRWLGTKNIGGYALMEREVKTHACFNCPVGCAKEIKYQDKWVRWPEYETLAMLGSNLMVDDLDKIIKWNVECNDLGIDTISLGSTIAMFLEAIERGLLNINTKELGLQTKGIKKGIDVWGATKTIEKLINMIGYRDGIGNELAEGVKRFCEKNGLPEDLATHGKGLEVPAHEPRANNMTALDYITSPRGAYHCYMPMDISSGMYIKEDLGINNVIDRFSKEKRLAELVKLVQDASEAYSACGGCIFGFKWIPEVSPWIESLNAITGRSYTVTSWLEAGERIFNLKRTYNMDCGITKSDDKIGIRFLKPIEKGGTRGNIPPLEELLPIYYEIRGWTSEGHPNIEIN
jgi:aldehyde:ferredoxin oxidoreductase